MGPWEGSPVVQAVPVGPACTPGMLCSSACHPRLSGHRKGCDCRRKTPSVRSVLPALAPPQRAGLPTRRPRESRAVADRERREKQAVVEQWRR